MLHNNTLQYNIILLYRIALLRSIAINDAIALHFNPQHYLTSYIIITWSIKHYHRAAYSIVSQYGTLSHARSDIMHLESCVCKCMATIMTCVTADVLLLLFVSNLQTTWFSWFKLCMLKSIKSIKQITCVGLGGTHCASLIRWRGIWLP